MKITFRPLDEVNAREIACWRYDAPYDIYNLGDTDDAIQYAIDPHNAFHSMRDEAGNLIGFCSFGSDGQVPGGDYSAEALDIGMGIRPGLTGQGRGSDFVAAVLDFARCAFKAKRLRVTIAAFNQRAMRVWEQNGFQRVQTFRKEGSDREFIILTRDEQ